MAASEGSVLQINAYDLSENEVDYELWIRNQLYEESDKQKRDRLRKAFLEEGNDTIELTEDIYFVNELPIVTRKLEEIEYGLARTIQVKWISQLRHWRERIIRAKVVDLAQGEQKVEVLSKIRNLIKLYKTTAIRLMNLSDSDGELGESKRPDQNQFNQEKEREQSKAPRFSEQMGKPTNRSFDHDTLSKAVNSTIGDYFKQFPNIAGMKISIDRDDKTKKKISQDRDVVKNLGAVPKTRNLEEVPKRSERIYSVERQNYTEPKKDKKHKTFHWRPTQNRKRFLGEKISLDIFFN